MSVKEAQAELERQIKIEKAEKEKHIVIVHESEYYAARVTKFLKFRFIKPYDGFFKTPEEALENAKRVDEWNESVRQAYARAAEKESPFNPLNWF